VAVGDSLETRRQLIRLDTGERYGPCEMREEVVVTQVRYRGPRRSRNLEERLMVRFPSLTRRVAALVFRRLSPRSRLRRVLLRRGVISGWSSFDRRDVELNLVFFDRNLDFELPSGMDTLGLDDARGHAGRIAALEKIMEVWGVTEFEPVYVLDLGERVLFLGFFHAQGSGSGVALHQEVGQLATFRGGLVTRDQTFFSWEEGFQAAGLDSGAIDLPARGPYR
jgi:hypothetical protein